MNSFTNPFFELVCELRGYTVLNNIKRGNIVIDVGSGTGFTSCYFAKLTGKEGQVIALEPDKHFLKILRYNIKINHLKNVVKVVDKGMYNKSTSISFSKKDFKIKSEIVNDSEEVIQIKTTTLKDLIINNALDPNLISFIKLDIEGAEQHIIHDLLKFIETYPNTISAIASYHILDNGKASHYYIEEVCKDYTRIFCKCIFPLHPTTYLVNIQNTKFIDLLIKNSFNI